MPTTETRPQIMGEGETVAEYYKRIGRTQTDINNNPINTGQITGDSLTPVAEAELPETEQPTDFGSMADANLASLLDQFNQTTNTEQASTDLQQRLMESLGTLSGEGARKRELEGEAGLPGQRGELTDITGQLRALSFQRAGIPLEIQQDAVGRGMTAGGAAPIQASRLRANTIESLQLAARGAILQENIGLAQQNIANALEAEFEPERIKLDFLKQAYLFNKDILDREDKQRSQNLEIALNERTRILGIQESNKKEIYNIGLTAQKFGAPEDIVKKAFESETPEEALLNVGQYMQDPQAILALKNAKLTNELTKIQITKEQEELDVYRRYGGLTPFQWLSLKKTEEKEKQEQIEKATKNLEESEVKRIKNKNEVIKIDNLTTQIDAILDSSALDSIVGPTPWTRGVTRTGGIFANIGAPLSLFGGGGAIDELSGNADDTVALVEQLVSQQFLDKLIEVKGQGATFGALSDREGNSLRSAANAIGSTVIENKAGKTIGYDMSEKEFKKQMGIMLEALEVARNDISDEALPSYDPTSSLLDRAYGEIDLLRFNPSF